MGSTKMKTDQWGNTELHTAALNGDFENLPQLQQDHPELLSQEGSNGRLPVDCVLFTPMADDEHERQKRAESALEMLKCYPEALQHHDKTGEYVSHKAMKPGFETLIQWLIKNKGIVDKQQQDGFYPIHQAILNDLSPEIVGQLLALSDKIAKQADFQGHNALDYAAMYGSKDLVTAVATHYKNLPHEDGASPLEQEDREGNTPLLLAAAYQNHDAVEALKALGAKEEAVNDDGEMKPITNLEGQSVGDLLSSTPRP